MCDDTKIWGKGHGGLAATGAVALVTLIGLRSVDDPAPLTIFYSKHTYCCVICELSEEIKRLQNSLHRKELKRGSASEIFGNISKP